MTLETRYNGDKITAEWFNSIKDELDFSSATANYLKVDADYVADMREAHIGIDASLNPVTVTLPTAVGNNGKKINIKSLDVTNAAVIDDADANTLLTFAEVEEVAVYVSDGASWQLFSNLADLNALETQVNTNTGDIATNATDIGTNTTDIATNVTDIGTNTTDIATNATDIGTNATNLTTHEADYEAHREFGLKAALITWALTADNGSYAFATDEKKSYQAIDGLLEEIGGGTGGISQWVSGETYEVGDQVYYTDNNIYRCSIANSDVTFTPANWTELSAGTTDHNNLINLQGGNGSNEFYHLTNTQNTNVVNENYGKQTLSVDGAIGNVTQVELDASSNSVDATLPASFDGKFLSVYASDLTNEAKISGTFFDGSTEYVFKNINTPIQLAYSASGWMVQSKTNFVDTTISESARFYNGAGYGSTNTKIPYWTVEVEDTTNTLVSIQNDTTNGFSITALKDCTFSGHYSFSSATIGAIGWSLNSTQLTTNQSSINAEDRVASSTIPVASFVTQVSADVNLKAGDVLRPHTNGEVPNNNTRMDISFTVTGEDERVVHSTDSKAEGAIFFEAAYASTNNKIPYYATELSNTTGNVVTIENSATLGLSITAIKDSVVQMHTEAAFLAGAFFGSSIDSTSLTTGISSLAASDRTSYVMSPTANVVSSDPVSVFLAAGQVLRPHWDGDGITTTQNEKRTSIRITAIPANISDTILALALPKVALVKEIKGIGVVGGTATTGAWTTRTLTDVQGDSSIVTLAANAFTLKGAGTFHVKARAIFRSTSQTLLRLNDTTNALTYVGDATFKQPGQSATASNVDEVITTTGDTVFNLEYYASSTGGTTDLGVSNTAGVVNVYTVIEITKLK